MSNAGDAAQTAADIRNRAAGVEFEDVDPADAAARRAIELYFAELNDRFPDGFDAGDPADGDAFRPPSGRFVLARNDGEPICCGCLQTIADGVGEIKRMWVRDGWRGAGLGSRVLRELERRAGEMELSVVRLDTHVSLVEAVAMYERAGYRRVDRYNDNPYAGLFFEKRL
ncbi:putative acetyltransferase [Gordonia araii NBRC 100433]|uniref:Putative acetyltransferase n=1 Tax=Gordonia araii NBRC 100433 TaxID=1073574 RepID=G7H421_9ACTN|nr:GNAT family N-acetyltransferase [Gordonia araii]NNG96339.1 GNAT family N-acetyltransferase [Gordonia araii NBRC 100433]GAB10596.1 putative acetyltransferase [Gordonia araii NBRC 100433]